MEDDQIGPAIVRIGQGTQTTPQGRQVDCRAGGQQRQEEGKRRMMAQEATRQGMEGGANGGEIEAHATTANGAEHGTPKFWLWPCRFRRRGGSAVATRSRRCSRFSRATPSAHRSDRQGGRSGGIPRRPVVGDPADPGPEGTRTAYYAHDGTPAIPPQELTQPFTEGLAPALLKDDAGKRPDGVMSMRRAVVVSARFQADTVFRGSRGWGGRRVGRIAPWLLRSERPPGGSRPLRQGPHRPAMG